MASASHYAALLQLGRPSVLRASVPCGLLALLALCAAPAIGGDWKVSPQLGVSERFSDNLSLSGNAESGFVTTISPGVKILREGGRVRADISYVLDNYFYLGVDRNNASNNKLRASVNAELIDPWFYVDADASISRAVSSLLGAFGTDETTAGQFADVSSVSLTPRVRYRHGRLWLGEASLRTSYVNSSGSALANSIGNAFRAGITSGSAFDTVGWSADYFTESVRHDSNATAADLDSQKIDAGVSYKVAPKIRLLGNVGYEEFESASLNDEPNGNSWSIGALWQPTNRSSFRATAGRRFFGNSFGLDLSHRTRWATWSVAYSEAITSTRSQVNLTGDLRRQLDTFLQAGGITDPIERARQIDSIVDRVADQNTVFSNQLFLQKRLQGTVIWDLRRHTLVLSAFGATRDINAVGGRRSVLFGNTDFGTSRFIRETGASATWSWQLMPKTSAVSTASTSRTEFTDIDRDDEAFLLSFGLLHQLSRHASGTLELRHQTRESSVSGLDFDENSLEAGLRLTY
jgi:uncharacterized protein (PEP-CTERM system associated)